MDIVSTGPLPVASLVWQPRPGAWVMTVVCKATWILRPGECTLAPAQEPPLAEDRHHGDDPARSLRCPRDVVPVKPSVDVMLVGSVFTPERRPAQAIDVRLSVGEIDKTIEAIVDRTLRPDGSVREGAPFTQMPILYERTGGGPGTQNPVGMPREGRGPDGGIVLPSLQRPGASLHNAFEPVGFGPIAPSWPERRERLKAAGTELSFRDLAQRPLPEGMDLGFFNAAPRDQQLRVLGDPLRLSLENLHPEHPKLVTTVPTAPPRAVLEGRREGPVAVTLRADTLWIDTDRGLCTVTFRGVVPLQAADERGRIVVSWEPAPRAAPSPAAPTAEARPGAPARPEGLPPVMPVSRKYDMTADIPLEVRRSASAALPFMPAPSSAPLPPAVVAPASPPAITQAADPSSISPITPSAPASPWTVPSRPIDTAPPSYVVSRPAEPASSVFEVSTAAAGSVAAKAVVRPAPALPAPEPEPAKPAPRAEVQEAIELIWFDPEGVPRIRRKAEWRPLLEALEKTPLDPDFDDPAFARDPMIIEDRREVFQILAHAEPMSADGLEAALGRCLRPDGKFVPALGLFAAELELPFDELSALRATVTTVSPLVGQDDALKSAVQAAKDFLATPGLMSAPAVAEGLTKRIEDAFAQGKRVVPVGYLEAQRERALLEQRQYQRRAVFGGKHLRGLLKLSTAEPAQGGKPGAAAKPPSGSAGVVVPAYLSEALADLLPLAPRFRARMVAEIRLAADRYETHPASLRVIALARAAPPPKA